MLGTRAARIRVAALALVAVIATSLTATAPPRQGGAAAAVRGAAPRAAAPRRCLAGVDPQLVHLVAPVTIARLARPPRATPALGRTRRVFPVLGPYPAFTDTFGAGRAGVDWHHGDDLFAPTGTPVLAVASGTVFSVGWQHLGGRRLWLIDRDGNEYYYAHLSRFGHAARDGERVAPGQLLGYVGDTGDAEGTPPHLHFEIHPAALLRLGYDGAVDPTAYLRAWRQLRAAVLPARVSCGR